MITRLALCIALGIVPATQAQTVPQSQAEMSLSFAPLVRETAPAVVNIYISRVVEERASPFADDPFFEQFFRDFGTPQPRVQNSLGSGVILSADGLVVSNYHVVGDAADIRVVLTDRREYAATVVMGDEASDLAVLRLTGAVDLPTLPLRDSDDAEVGELVLAIGNPFGIGQTVSSGIVSALARSSMSLGRGTFIQTDAPINPGNSGGALVDMQGRLLGINSAILTRSGGSNGIGFAIPANLVGAMLNQVQSGGTAFLRPWAGLSAQAIDPQLAEALDLPRIVGVLVQDMHPQSPFAAAGLQPGDVITTLDGDEVNSPEEMLYRITVAGIGTNLPLDYVRNGEARTATVALSGAPASSEPPLQLTSGPFAGLTLAQIGPAEIAALALPVTATGAVITRVEGLLTRAGLAPGDIVLALNGAPVTRPDDFAALAQSGARRWELEILRAGTRVRLRLRL